MSREYPHRPLVGVGVVLLDGDRVLLIRRGKPPRKGGLSLPGGAQKLGETVFEAAVREVREETGLEARVVGLVDVVDSISRDADGGVQYHYTLVDVAAVVDGPVDPVAGGDAADAMWVPLADLPSLDLWSETRRIIAQAKELVAGSD